MTPKEKLYAKKFKDKNKLDLLEKVYIPEIARGMSVTISHFFRHNVTTQYPEERREIPPRFRGLHVLKRDELGRERCVACGLCELVCPSDAIHIEAAEVPPERRDEFPEEKYAKVYEIDMIRCIFCGFCQEACPKGAIYLEQEYELADDSLDKFIYSKEMLLEKAGGPIKMINDK